MLSAVLSRAPQSQLAAGVCPGPSFNTAPTFRVGNDPVAIAAGDFNRDGNADLAVANSLPAIDISILLGDGHGGFITTPGISMASINTPAISLTVGDFNKDGNPDLVALAGVVRSPYLFLGNGQGGFGPPVLSKGGNGPRAIVTADLNNDGFTDLAVANDTSNDISVFLGISGGLAPAKSIQLVFPATFLDVGDINGDNNLDIVVGSNLAELIGDGAGNFSVNYVVSNTQSLTNVVKIADFNNDGKADLLTQANAASMRVQFGDGTGTFPTNTSIQELFTTKVEVGDFNQDGKADFVAIVSGGVSLLLGNGDGTFLRKEFSAGSISVALTQADFNHDGRRDLGVVNQKTFDVSILLGTAGGEFAAAQRYKSSIATNNRNPSGIATGDFNKDGLPDFAVANFDLRNVVVFLNEGNGFKSGKSYSVAPDIANWLSAGDLNNDGNLDLIYSYTDLVSHSFKVLYGLGDGNFNSPAGSQGIPGTRFIPGDFNNDGLADLACLDTSVVRILINGAPGGTFNALQTWDTGLAVSSLNIADLNNDGNLDLLVTKTDGSQSNLDGLWIGFGNGAGGIISSKTMSVGKSPRNLAVGDFNVDGKADFAVGVELSGSAGVSIYLGDGNGNFTFRESVPNARPNANFLATGDFDGDGKIDLAVSDTNAAAVSVLMGQGTGTFSLAGNYGTGPEPRYLATNDLNRDGKSDILIANASGGDTTVMLTVPCIVPTPTPTPTPSPTPTPTPTPSPTPSGPPVLMTEANSNRAIALDSVTMLRDPFTVQNLLNFSSDRRTRILIFATNLVFPVNEPFSAVTVQAENSQHNVVQLPVEFVGNISGLPATVEIVVKLTDGLSGDQLISITYHNLTSNKALVSIKSSNPAGSWLILPLNQV